MKTIRKEMSIGRYVFCLGAVLALLCGLTLWLSSCDKDIPGRGSGSGNIELKFVLGSASYDEGEPETRGYGVSAREPETVVVPIGGDLYLYATLEAASADPNSLRAETITVGTRVMIVAYNSTHAYVDAKEYKVTASGISPVGTGLSVPSAGSYTFVVYSINSTASVPAHSTTVTISPDNDLLYGKTATTQVVDGVNTISVSMSHKFSQLTVNAVASNNIDTIGDVTFTPNYNANLNVQDGTFGAKGTAVTRIFSSLSFSNLHTPVATSAAQTVYTADETFTLGLTFYKVGSDTTRYNGTFSVKFDNTVLESGKKYTLSLNFGRVRFAASSVYWDGSKLTFDPWVADVTTPEAQASMQKQGVYFLFGSLIGISAGQTAGSNNFVAGTSADSTGAASTRLYVPYYKNSKEYLDGTPGTEKVWTQTNAGTRGWTWNGTSTTVPYYGNDVATGTRNRYDNSVIAESYNTESNWKIWKGDICRFIDSDYRLPYSYEFGDANGLITSAYVRTRWTATGTLSPDNSKGSVDGRATLGNAGVTSITTDYYFPASGYRSFTNGALSEVCAFGNYWSGSANNPAGYYLTFGLNRVRATNSQYRYYGVSVRCVKK